MLKIVVTGSFAAGKTQFIRSISDIEVVDTDFKTTTSEERGLKSETTVALDFGTIAITPTLKLYLFGTPGQVRFDYMWEELATGCIGYVVLVDSCRPAYFAETQHLMQRFTEITPAPFVVAANKQDDPAALPPMYVRRRLGIPAEIPVLPCVAAERSSVKLVLISLLKHITSYGATSDAEDDVADDAPSSHASSA